MNIRRIAFALFLFASLACSFITRVFSPPTPVPTQSPTVLAPAYIPPECQSIPLATVPAATALAEPAPALHANQEISTEVQLRVFDEAVNTIEDVYVYPDFNGVDWPGIVSKHRLELAAGLDTEAFYTVMDAMILELGDEHSFFESPVEVAESQSELAGSSEFIGIGAFILPLYEKGKAAIISVYPDSPAERGGLKPHDSILAVDGIPVVEADQLFIQRVRGPQCSATRLTVQSPNQAPRDLLLVRYRIEGGAPVESRLVPTLDGSRVGYIQIPTFFDRTITDRVISALNEFEALDALILDNRFNGGGSSDVLVPTLSLFTSGTLGNFTSRASSQPLTIAPNPIQDSQTVPLVVLVGEDTASFGEIFAGVLRDRARAQIVGQTTLGNVEILHSYNFEDGSRLWIAEDTFEPAASHADWEATGIVPDVEAYAGWDTFTFETDPAIAAALTLLGHR